MADPIRQNKLQIFGLLQAIDDGVKAADHAKVDEARARLSLLAQLENERPDELAQAVRKVFDASGRWDRGVAREAESAEIAPLVEEAIQLLNAPTFGSRA
jgi:hypothetical protein